MKENEIAKKKLNFGLIIIIVSFLFIGIGCTLFIVNSLNNKPDNKETIKPDDSGKIIDKNTITKEEAEKFLNELVPDNYFQDLLFEKDEKRTFYHCVQYLAFKNKYTKNEYTYTFKESDIKEAARKYFESENFDYSIDGLEVTYDESNKTVNVVAIFGLINDNGPTFTKEKSIKDFKYENGVAEVNYYVKIIYDKAESLDPNVDPLAFYEKNYKIHIIKVNDELRIKNVSIIEVKE